MIFGLMSVFFILYMSSLEEKKYRRERNFEGRIRMRYIDYGMKSNPVVLFYGDGFKYDIGNVYSHVDTGDYIIKKAGTEKIVLVKKSTTDTFEYYP